MSEIITVEPTKFELVIQSSGVENESAVAIRGALSPFFAQAIEWQAKIETVTDPKVARASRLVLKNIRVEAGHKKDELKSNVLKVTRAIDGAFKAIESTISPMEETLEAVEKKAEREEAARKAALAATRANQLAPFGVDSTFFNLVDMPEESFAKLLDNSKTAHEAKIAAAAKSEADRIAAAKLAEEQRIAREAAEAAERERVRAENERLRKEAAEREAALKKEREAAVEAARVAAEKARKEREAIEAKAKADREAAETVAKKERAAREKLEREAQAARDAEKHRQDAEAAELARAAAAPDREKLIAFAALVRTLEVPEMATKKGRSLCGTLKVQIETLARRAEQAAEEVA